MNNSKTLVDGYEEVNGRLARQEAATRELDERTARIERYTLLAAKRVFNLDEAALFLSLKKSYLYKLTSTNQIPFYRPNGKLVYFEKADLENWLRSNRVSSSEEIAEKAATYVATSTMKKGGAR